MKTRLFFSFNYTHDRYRVEQVMQLVKSLPNVEFTTFIHPSLIKQMEIAGPPLIYQWIESETDKADVCIVLITGYTHGRHFIDYEIFYALQQKKPLFAIHINTLLNEQNQPAPSGNNILPPVFAQYHWHNDNAALNVAQWIQKAIALSAQQYNVLSGYKTIVKVSTFEELM